MRRVVIATLLACVILVPVLAAQTAAQARVIRLAVIVEQPRGDAPIITRIPPGAIVDLLSRNGDWYQVALTQEPSVGRRTVGWVYRDVVELLPNQPAVAVTTRAQPATPVAPPPAVVSQPVAPAPAIPPQPAAPPPRVVPQPVSSELQRYMRPGMTELIITGGITGTSVDGETASVFNLSGIVGFVIPARLEPIVIANITKASDIDAFGEIGGGLFVNFAGKTPIVPFVGGAFGTTLGASGLLDGLLNESQYIAVTGGFRVMMPRGGGSLIVRPFFQHRFVSSDLIEVPDVNQFGVAVGVSILF